MFSRRDSGMPALVNSTASGFHSALAETLERLGEKFESELHLARREQSERLNQIIRRLRQSAGEKPWSEAVADGASGFAPRCLLLAVEDGKLRLLAWRGRSEADPPASIPLSESAAFRSVVESAEPVVALRGARELPVPLYRFLGDPQDGRFFLFPVVSGDRTAAVLYADSETGEPESSCLEIVAAAAGAALPGPQVRWKKPEGLVEIERLIPGKRTSQSWDDLSPADQAIHWKAQRVARARIAGMLLYHHDAVARGRADHDLYGHLKEQIDSGRDEFGKDFLESCGSMVDYFHLELLSRIANNDAGLLGSGYPGPMLQSASVPDRVA